METLALPWMLSYNLGCSCCASLALTFLVVHDVRVKVSHVSPGFRFMLRTKIKYIFGHILIFIFNIFFSIHIPGYFQEFGKRHPQALIPSERCVIFEKKIQNFDYPVHWSLKITNARALFSLSYVQPRLALTPRGLRAHSKSVESRTSTDSSHVTLAPGSRRAHSVKLYSRRYRVAK